MNIQKNEKKVDYSIIQYNAAYIARLNALVPEIDLEKLKNDHKDAQILSNLSQIGDQHGIFLVKAVLVATAKNKETIFDECDLVQKPIEIKPYAEICYFLEDQTSRIEVIMDENVKSRMLVPGQVLGFVIDSNRGRIKLKDFIYPKGLDISKTSRDNFICFIANPEIDDETGKLRLLLKMIEKENKITDLVILGKLCKENTQIQYASLEKLSKDIAANVHIIPNIGDLTNGVFPLSPINKKILNLSGNCYSNPCCLEIGLSFQFVPEQSVESIEKYYTSAQPTEILKKIHKGRHLCPTAPDTLGCAPYEEVDPFFMNKPANFIFSVGDKFSLSESKDESQSSFFIVPSFTKTSEIALYNCKTNKFETFSLEY